MGKLIILLLVLFLSHKSINAQAVVQTTINGTGTTDFTGNFTSPVGVDLIRVEAWGGGGGGGARNGITPNRGAGGGGGAYAGSTHTVIPSTTYPYKIGGGGTSSNGTRPAGQSTTFNTNWVIAAGGTAAGNNNTTPGSGGTVALSTASGTLPTKHKGGEGCGPATTAGRAGSGGGGAGSKAPGKDASAQAVNTTPGGATGDNGGAGAEGSGTVGNAGNNGSNFGGAGSGGYSPGGFGSPTRNGGTGAPGGLRITYNAIPAATVISPNSSAICKGEVQELTASLVASMSNAVLFNETFNEGSSWTTVNTSTGGTPASANWTLRGNGYQYLNSAFSLITFNSNDNSRFYMSNSNEQGGGTGAITNTALVSPAFSTLDFTSLSLSFFYYYRFLNSESAKVEISLDNSSWTNLTTYTSTQGSPTSFINATISIPSGFLNKPTVYLRFKYDATFDWYWAIDNIVLSGTYQPYITWTPVTSLFTDNAATIPYTSGTKALTVYAKPSATTTYTANSNNAFNQNTTGLLTVSKTNVVINVLDPGGVRNAPLGAQCSGSTLNFTSTTVGGNGTYTYYWSAINPITTDSSNTFSYTPTNTTNANVTSTVTLEVTSNGKTCSQTFSPITYPVPVLSTTLPDLNYCHTDSTSAISLAGTPDSVLFNYSGTGANIGLSNGISVLTIPSFIATNADDTAITRTITVTPISNGCSGTGVPFDFIVNSIPNTPTSITPTVATSICHGQSINVSATSSGNTIEWFNLTTGGVFLGSSASNVQYPAIPDSSGRIFAQSKSAAGCVSSTRGQTAIITVNKVLPPSTPSVQNVCSDTTHVFKFLNLSTSAGSNLVEWSMVNNFSTFSVIDSAVVTVNTNSSDTIWIRAKNTVNGCTSLPVLGIAKVSNDVRLKDDFVYEFLPGNPPQKYIRNIKTNALYKVEED